jgi:pimeloyl-ACP methyl ester carboxylesterase
MVKGSHQQATYDMLMASRAVLDHLKVRTSKLFLAGWSQGGFVTMAFLEKLEQADIPVQAAATASAPVDIFTALNGFLNFPRKNDASWVTTLFILSSFSFENYYGIPGLARSVITDDAYDIARRAYERLPFDAADIPTKLRELVDRCRQYQGRGDLDRPDHASRHLRQGAAGVEDLVRRAVATCARRRSFP